jgi:hypothetical protein
MTDIKRSVRNSTYVALGTCALGISHLSKKREVISNQFNSVSSQITPKIGNAAENITNTLTTTFTPLATTVYERVKKQSEIAINSTLKIAQEAKNRIK